MMVIGPFVFSNHRVVDLPHVLAPLIPQGITSFSIPRSYIPGIPTCPNYLKLPLVFVSIPNHIIDQLSRSGLYICYAFTALCPSCVFNVHLLYARITGGDAHQVSVM